MSEGRTLISLEVSTVNKLWNRTYLADYVPTIEQFECYYRVLCGFQDATVQLSLEPVPEGFNEKLLKPLDTAPTVFPLSDLETDPDEAGEEKRTAYKNFIKQLISMETNRIRLNFFVEAPKEESAWLSTKDKHKIHEYRAWVDELLEALSAETLSTDVEQSSPTMGWLLTPAAEAARRLNGYRLLTNQDMGKVWETLLGTDHFPDIVVKQKLHASSWNFQHEVSTSVLKSVLEWYIHAKHAVVYEGVSDWLPRVDTELHTLLAAFVSIAPRETERVAPALPPKALLPFSYACGPLPSREPKEPKEPDPEFESLPASAFPQTGSRLGRPPKVVLAPPVPSFEKPFLREEFSSADIPVATTPTLRSLKEVLRHVENLLAPATMFADCMEPCAAEVFRGFVDCLCYFLELTDAELDEKVFERWEKNKMGFRPDLFPIIAEWFKTWRTIIRNNATVERVKFFIKTVSLSKESTPAQQEKDAVVDGWIQIFAESYLVKDPAGTVQAIDLHEQCKLFCLQFIPPLYAKFFSPMTIGPYFTKRGFTTRKRQQGRYTHGIRYRRHGEAVQPTVHITNTYEQTTTTSAAGDTIQHISSTTEINLGLL